MNKPTDFFNRTFKYSFFIILSFGFLFRIIPFSIALLKSSNELDIYLWLSDTLYGLLSLSLFALIIPWISLSFYGEYFYTRSLNRKDIFNLFRNQHIKFLSVLSILLLSSVWIYNKLVNSYLDSISFNTSLFFVTITIFISLIIAGNTNTLKKIIKYSLPILLIYPFLSSNYVNGIDIKKVIFTAMWLIYLFFVYKVVSKYDSDIDLNVAGKVDDENKSLANMWIFNKEFNYKNKQLKNPSFFSSFKLLVANTSNIYLQLFLIINVVMIYFSLKDLYVSYTDPVTNINSRISENISTLSLVSLVFIGIYLTINPKYIVLQVEEFLSTRAVSKSKIYISNFLFQGLFILGLVLLDLIFPSIDFISGLNVLSLALTLLWLYISGEMGILLLIALFINDFTFMILKSDLMPNTSISLLINILSPNINGLIVWLAAISFRLLDYLWFINKEIGFVKDYKKFIFSISKLYIPSFLLSLSLVIFAAYNNPYTKFINSMSASSEDRWDTIGSESVFALFKKNRNEVEKSIYSFIEDPYDLTKALNFSKEYYINQFYYMGVSYGPYRMDPSYMSYKNNISYILKLAEPLKDTPEYNYQQSIISKYENNYSKAYDFSIKSLKDKNNVTYLYNLANIYEHEFKNKESIEVLKKINDLRTNSRYQPLREIGNIYWNNNNFDKAIEYYAESSLIEHHSFVRRNYYYLGLMDKLYKINENPKYNSNPEIRDFFNSYLNSLNNEKEINVGSINNLGGNMLLDLAKKAENRGDLKKAEQILLKTSSSYSQQNLAYLALIQAQIGKNKEAEESINRFFRYSNFNKNFIIKKTIFKDRVYYFSNIFKASLILNKDNNKTLDLAKAFIITSSDTQKAWDELKLIVKPNYLSELEGFKNNYIDLYNSLENKGMSLISNKKTLEKTLILFDFLNDEEKLKYKEIYTSLHKSIK